MEDCIFCKIARGEIPSEKTVYEAESAISFPDIHPVRPGHTILIPKAHYRWFWEMPDDVSNNLFKVARRLSAELKEKTGADYIHLSIVGKDVPHVHIHLIPNKFGDKLPPA
jgi:histidine triad (HIT) family protein